MRLTLRPCAVVATALATTLVSAQNKCYQEGGNYYCDSVQAIAYSNFGLAGSYNRVTAMDGTSGTCSSAKQSYSGGMAPFDGEVSWHFRGPMNIKQFAYYTLGGRNSKTKRDEVHRHPRRHAHQNFHDKAVRDLTERKEDIEKRAVGDPVVVTVDGQVWSWTNQYDGGAAATPAPAPAAPAQNQDSGSESDQRVDNSGGSGSGSSSSSNTSPTPATDPGSGNWGRQAYYNAASGEATGLVFLNNKGGDACSGTFDYKFGNSLSYASADGSSCAPSPQILRDGYLSDAVEVVLMTDKKCAGSDCGFVRPKSVAHHGFDGASKLFLLEFDMPLSGKTGFNEDMPAAWILNAAIPRTAQYANPAQCSCWESGCGEWDIFEVLDAGNLKCKSTWHGVKSHGDSNWFARPTEGSRKAAVILDGEGGVGTIVYLPDDVAFDEVISVAASNAFTSKAGNVVQARLPS